MRHLILFVTLFIVVASAKAQENKTIQVPPVRTTDNVKPQPVNTVQTAPLRTADIAKQQSANKVQSIAIRTSDATGVVQSANTGTSTIQNKTVTAAKLQPPSSISSSQAQGEQQKKGAATKKTD